MEGIVLLMVAVSPWFFGAVDPVFEYALLACISLIAVLWGVRAILDRQFLWFACPVALCLGLIFLAGILQLVPMPSFMLYVASPMTADLNSDLRPQQPEVIAEGEPSASHAPWPTISVYPHATQQWLVRLLAVLVLFAAVRVNIASTEALRRLAWVAFINGVALAVFALVQFVRAKSKGPAGDEIYRVYGYLTRGQVFGPFINRNHFPYYLNICIGLGVGLLLISGKSESDKRAHRTHKAQALVEQTAEDETAISILSILHSPLQLWISVGLAVMVSSVIASFSRGGVAALILGLIAAVLLRGLTKVRYVARIQVLIVPVLLVFGLIAWLGLKPLETRLALTGKDLTSDGRLVMWWNLLGLVWRFPIFGSGNGTLEYVEPLTRSADYGGYNAAVDIDHAHNDYLEGLVEGGFIRLGLTLAIVLLLIGFARKAMRRHEIRTPGRLAFGATIGIMAVAIHSFVDFGLSTPAVACLATVTAAYLATMARSDPSEPPTRRSKHGVVVKLGGYGDFAAAGCMLLIALVLLRNGSANAQVDELRISAFRYMHAKPPSPKLAIDKLKRAVEKSPMDAKLWGELGQVYFEWYDQGASRDARVQSAATATSLAGSMSTESVFGALGHWSANSKAPIPKQAEFDQYIRPALQAMITARDLLPLLARPHARLAVYAVDSHPAIGITMAKSDPALVYCARAVRLTPFDADILYTYGAMLLQAGKTDAAWEAWRQSLVHKPSHLRSILNAAVPKIGAEAVVAKILPNDPNVLLESARIFLERPELSPSIKPLLERAKNILMDRAVDSDPNLSHQLAQCLRMLGETGPAILAYRQALLLAPNNPDWKYEYAEYLFSLPNERERTLELKTLLDEMISSHPNYWRAKSLKAIVDRERP